MITSSVPEKILLMTSPSTSMNLTPVLLSGEVKQKLEVQMQNEPPLDHVKKPSDVVQEGGQSAVVPLDDENDGLQKHIEANLVLFDNKFRNSYVDYEARMLRDPAKKKQETRSSDDPFIFSSRIDQYYLLHPSLYRRKSAVTPIEFDALMKKLAQFPSLFPRDSYEAVLGDCLEEYERAFDEDVNAEATLRMNFDRILVNILREARGAQKVEIRRKYEVLSAAAGHVAKRREDAALNEVDDCAGVAGKCDMVFFFGTGDKQDMPVCAAEFKLVGVSAEAYDDKTRWFTKTGALLPQTIQSHIGHDSPLSLAVTQHGFKVFLKEEIEAKDLSQEERDYAVHVNGRWTRIFTWPPGPELFIPRLDLQVDDGLRVIAEVARLATGPFTRKRKIASIGVKGQETESANAPSTPSGKKTKPLNPDTEDRRNPALSSRAASREHLFLIKTEDGGVLKLRSIDLEGHFSDEEIEKFLLFEYEYSLDEEVAGG